jgi:hypothetical protein
MKEQQIQRYEFTDDQSASISRLHDVVQALSVTVELEFNYADKVIPSCTCRKYLNMLADRI